MSEDKSEAGDQDRKRISLSETSEVRDQAASFGVELGGRA